MTVVAQADSAAGPEDSGRAALEFVHRLLLRPPAESAGLDGLLAELAAAFGTPGAGLALWPAGAVVHHRPADGTGGRRPWEDNPALPGRALESPAALTVPRAGGGSLLLTAAAGPNGPGWLLWLEDAGRTAWDAAAAAALTLAAHALLRSGAGAADRRPRWAEHLERADRQRRLEAAAQTAARLAHDYGNVLTGILGFSELSLAQRAAADGALNRYLRELHQAAQTGAQLTHQLRLFSRRQAGPARPCEVAPVVAAEAARLGQVGDRPFVQAALPDDLPRALIDADGLRAVLAALLDNAREATAGAGVAAVTARAAELTADDCLDAYGDLRPGPHLCLSVADAGTGLGPDVRRRLFAEPFFSTKPRRGGFGLATAYGVLRAYRGGLRLRPGPSGGAVAEVFVPAAAPAPPPAPAPAAGGDRVLVVDDDPMILQFVCTTLAHAGYRVHAAPAAEDALTAYAAAGADPFRLVLADLVMPHVTGVDLARRLLARDAEARVLFMSGYAAGEFARQDLIDGPFDLLSKPFRTEGLLRAVRTAIDRPARRPAARPSAAAGPRAN
jgi:signal transduction histidine kinase/CheY-like chemotaxis protein